MEQPVTELADFPLLGSIGLTRFTHHTIDVFRSRAAHAGARRPGGVISGGMAVARELRAVAPDDDAAFMDRLPRRDGHTSRLLITPKLAPAKNKHSGLPEAGEMRHSFCRW